MSIADDEQFKHYLEGFRPVAPDSLRTRKHSVPTRNVFLLSAAATASLAIFALAWLVIPHRPKSTWPTEINGSLRDGVPQSLTIGGANALLAHSPSFKAAVDEVSFQPQAAPQIEGRQSALTILGKENIKLWRLCCYFH